MDHRTRIDSETVVGPTELANCMGLSTSRVRKLAQEGIVQRGAGKGKYLLVQSLRAYVRYLHDLARDSGNEDETGKSYEYYRSVKMKAVAEIAELELARRRKELIRADEVEAAWSEIFAIVRNRMLALEDRGAGRTYQAREKAEHREIWRQVVTEVLTELSSIGIEAGEGPAEGKQGPRRGGKKGARSAQAPS